MLYVAIPFLLVGYIYGSVCVFPTIKRAYLLCWGPFYLFNHEIEAACIYLSSP